MTIPQALELATQHLGAGQLPQAETLCRQVLAAQPECAEALHLLGIVAHQVGRRDEAVALIGKAIAVNPQAAEYHNNLGHLLQLYGRPEEAIAELQRALELKPDSAEIHLNLGNAFKSAALPERAAEAYRHALALKPDSADALGNLAIALYQLGRLDEADATIRRALRLRPDSAELYCNLGIILRARNEPANAIAAFRYAIQLRPNFAEVYNNLGNALQDDGQLDKAIAAFQEAIQLEPTRVESHCNLGTALNYHGRLDDAIAVYRRAMQIDPSYAGAHGNLLLAMLYHPGFNQRALEEECARWDERHAQPLRKFAEPHRNEADPARRLRIGYVSGDFRDHVVGRNVMPLLANHDREQFEIVCYSGATQVDSMTDRFRALATTWRNTAGVSDERLAGWIREDGVDILVDLAQHTGGNRLLVFAREPAPVQVSFAGYPASAGLSAIGHRISDRFLESSTETRPDLLREQVALIESFWCYDPLGLDVEVNALPAAQQRVVTFGCLNNACKITEPCLALWAQVLHAVEGSRLVLLSAGMSHRAQIVEALRLHGIGPTQVGFVEARPRREYLAHYHQLDVVLDTFPYNGHTTSLDALWMGVPVVSLAGATTVSRAGLSQLSNLGLPELVAHSPAQFLEIARTLAADLPRLASLRAELRGRMKASCLCDGPGFARGIERVYREMWSVWCETTRSA